MFKAISFDPTVNVFLKVFLADLVNGSVRSRLVKLIVSIYSLRFASIRPLTHKEVILDRF